MQPRVCCCCCGFCLSGNPNKLLNNPQTISSSQRTAVADVYIRCRNLKLFTEIAAQMSLSSTHQLAPLLSSLIATAAQTPPLPECLADDADVRMYRIHKPQFCNHIPRALDPLAGSLTETLNRSAEIRHT